MVATDIREKISKAKAAGKILNLTSKRAIARSTADMLVKKQGYVLDARKGVVGTKAAVAKLADSPTRASPGKKATSSPKSKKLVVKVGSPTNKTDLMKMTVKQLQAKASAKGLEIQKGSGKGGRIVKADYVLAIVDAKARKSPARKVVISPKRTSPKASATKALSKSALQKMTVLQLTALCKEKGIATKCKRGTKKAAIIEALMYLEKASPAEKSPAKKAPAKKASKAKRCDDNEDWIDCKEGDVCSAASGRCVKDTDRTRKSKMMLNIDAGKDKRQIIGAKETLEKLQKILGGQIVSAEKAVTKASKPASSAKRPAPVVSAKRADIERTFKACLASL